MTKWQLRSKRKTTGAKRNSFRKKKRYQRARDFLPMQIGKKVVKIKKAIGSNEKRIMLSGEEANVIINGKSEKVKILSVKENTSNSQYVRRNIVTKGAVVETEKGLAKITSRPGQEGKLNAVLVSQDNKQEKK